MSAQHYTKEDFEKLEVRIEILENRVNQLFNFIEPERPLSQANSSDFLPSDVSPSDMTEEPHNDADVEAKTESDAAVKETLAHATSVVSSNVPALTPVFLRFDQIPRHILGRK